MMLEAVEECIHQGLTLAQLVPVRVVELVVSCEVLSYVKLKSSFINTAFMLPPSVEICST